MSSNKLISVIIPVYNGANYLSASINSVLAQTYQNIELIVVDDGSSDESANIAKAYNNILLLTQENSGIGAARNRGVEHAQGEYVAFLDHDDLWLPDKLMLQMQAFIDQPALDIVFGHVEQFISPEIADEIKAKIYCPVGAMPGYHSSAMLIKREAYNRVGTQLTTHKVGEFIDWYMRAQEQQLKMYMLPQVVFQRRLHGSNTMLKEIASRKDYLYIIKAGMDRRKQ